MNGSDSTGLKASNHREWVEDLRGRPRAEAARLIAERYPQLSDEEVQRRLRFLDAPPPKPVKPEPVKLLREIADARKAARLAEVKKGRPARQKDALELRLAAEARKARRDDARR